MATKSTKSPNFGHAMGTGQVNPGASPKAGTPVVRVDNRATGANSFGAKPAQSGVQTNRRSGGQNW